MSEALAIYDAAVTRADALADGRLQFDVRFERARGLRRAKQYADAYTAFVGLYNSEPPLEGRETALLAANQTLMAEEHDDCYAPYARGQEVSGVDHAATLESNMTLLKTGHADSPLVPEALLDLVCYYEVRSWWSSDKEAARLRLIEVAKELEQLAPESYHALRAALWRGQTMGAGGDVAGLQVLEQAAADAQRLGYRDIEYEAARGQAFVLCWNNRWAEAQAIWDELIRNEDGLQPEGPTGDWVEGENMMFLGLSRLWTGEPRAALETFQQTAACERYPIGVRATSQYYVGSTLARIGALPAARTALQQVIDTYPDEASAKTAAKLLEVLR